MNSKNLSKAINRVLAILLTAAMVAGSFTVPVKATEGDAVIEETSEPVSADGAAAEEVTVEEESDELIDPDFAIRNPDYPYGVKLEGVPTWAAGGTDEAYSWATDRNIKTNLLDVIKIKQDGGGDDGMVITTVDGVTADTYGQTVGGGGATGMKKDNDYGIDVYYLDSDGSTWKSFTDRASKDLADAGTYKLVVDVHDRLGRWDDHIEQVFKVHKYTLADFKDYLVIKWDDDADHTGPVYTPTSDGTSADNISKTVHKIGLKSLTDDDKAELKSKFGMTNTAIAALQSDLTGDSTAGATDGKFILIKEVKTAESDKNPKPSPAPDNYPWKASGDSLKVVRNDLTEDVDKPVLVYTANGSYSTTSAEDISYFLDKADTTEFEVPFSIIEREIADETVVMSEANASDLAKAHVSDGVKYNGATGNKASINLVVDVDKTDKNNKYEFDLKKYFAKINGTYCELEKVTLSEGVGNWFKTNPAVSISDNTVLTFYRNGVDGPDVSSSNNVIKLKAKYTNYKEFNVEITVNAYNPTAADGDFKFVGLTETAEGGLKIPYNADKYASTSVVFNDADSAKAAYFGLLNGDSPVSVTSENITYQYQEKLENGLWGNLTSFGADNSAVSVEFKTGKTYRLIATWDSKKAYSKSFTVVPAVLKSAAVSNITGGSAPYKVNLTGNAVVTDILDSANLTFGSDGKASGITLAKADYDIEYFHIDKAYTFDADEAEVDSSFDKEGGTIWHLVTGVGAPAANTMYKDMPYAKIVSKSDNYDKTKPLFVTFDLKDQSLSGFTVTETIDTITQAVKLDGEAYEIELPADIFSYKLNTSGTPVKTAVDLDDVTDLKVKSVSGVIYGPNASSDVVPSIVKTEKGYKLTFYGTAACGNGTQATVVITPTFAWPYRTAADVTASITFNNTYNVSLKENHKPFVYETPTPSGYRSYLETVGNYNVRINGTTVNPTGITVTVYPQAGPSPTTPVKIGGITYDVATGITDNKAYDAGNYLVKVTGITPKSGDPTATVGTIYVPFTIDQYELTEDDIVLATGVESLRADSADFDAVFGAKGDCSTGDLAPGTTKAKIQLISSFDGTTRAIGTTTTKKNEVLNRAEDTNIASRGEDTYCISVNGPTSVNADYFKYDVTFKLNKSKNYKMAESGITKTIKVKKVDVGMVVGSSAANTAGYSVKLDTNGLVTAKNGQTKIDTTEGWFYDGYEKNPKVRSVSIVVGDADGSNGRTAYKKVITNNKGVTYGENINAGAATIKIDFSDGMMYKGTLVLDNTSGYESFAIAQRTSADGLKEKVYEVEVPASATSVSYTTQIPLDIFELDNTTEADGKKKFGTDTATATAFAVKNNVSVSKKNGTTADVNSGQYSLTTAGALTFTANSVDADFVSEDYTNTPTFTNFATATDKLVIRFKAVDKDVASVVDTAVGKAGKVYDGNPATVPTIKIMTAAGDDVTGEVEIEGGWYANDGTTKIDTPVNAGTYKYKVTKVTGDYIVAATDIPYTIKAAVATVEEAAPAIYSGDDQAVVKVTGNGKELVLDTDYTISKVALDNADLIDSVAKMPAIGLAAGNYKNAGTYKLLVVGNGNYVIHEADKTETDNTGVVVKSVINPAPLTITLKSAEDLIMYKDMAYKFNTLVDPASGNKTGIAKVEGLKKSETVGLVTSGTLETALNAVTFPSAAPYEAKTFTLTKNDLKFTGTTDDNYDIKIDGGDSATFKISFARRPVTVDLKLYDSLGEEITGAVEETGDYISVDYKVTVKTPTDPVINLSEGTDYIVDVPARIKDAKTYTVKVKGVDTSVYDVEALEVEFIVSSPKEIEAEAAVTVGGTELKSDGTSKVEYTGTAMTPVVVLTGKTGETLTEEDYTIALKKDGVEAEEIKEIGEYTLEIVPTLKNYKFKENPTFTFKVVPSIIEPKAEIKVGGKEVSDGETVKYTGEALTIETKLMNGELAMEETAYTKEMTFTPEGGLEVPETVVKEIGTYKVTFKCVENDSFSFEDVVFTFSVKDRTISNVKVGNASLSGQPGKTLKTTVSAKSDQDPAFVPKESDIKVYLTDALSGAADEIVATPVNGGIEFTCSKEASGVFEVSIDGVKADKTITVTFRERENDPGTPVDVPTDYVKPGEESNLIDIETIIKSVGTDKTKDAYISKSYTYTGSPIEAAVIVNAKDNGVKLIAGTDYKVTYSNNVSATPDGAGDDEKAIAIISGIGKYDGEVDVPFTIGKKKISSATIVAGSIPEITDKDERAEAIGGAITVYDKTVILYNGEDEDCSYVIESSEQKGKKYSFVIKGTGNYTGEKKGSIAIVADGEKDVRSDSITITIDGKEVGVEDYVIVYNGKAQKPKVIVKDGETDVPVKVTYKNNKEAGTATVTITGKKPYVGSRVVTFSIIPDKANAIEASEITVKDMTYTGKLLKPSVTVKVGKKTLRKGKDYRIYYTSELNTGDKAEEEGGKVIIRGCGNYVTVKDGSVVDEIVVDFSIAQANFSKTKVAKDKSISTKPQGIYFNGKKLVMDEDFTAKITDVNTKGKEPKYTITVEADSDSRNFKADKAKTIKGTAAQIDWQQLFGVGSPEDITE